MRKGRLLSQIETENISTSRRGDKYGMAFNRLMKSSGITNNKTRMYSILSLWLRGFVRGILFIPVQRYSASERSPGVYLVLAAEF